MSSVYTNLFHKQKVVFSFKAIPCEPFVIHHSELLVLDQFFQKLAGKQMAIKLLQCHNREFLL